jgi:maleate cis-trans isomerase
LTGAGFEVGHDSHLGITDNASFAAVEPEVIETAVRGFPSDHPVVVVCTNLLACFPDAYVVDSLVAVLWYAMVLAAEHRESPGPPVGYRSVYDAVAARWAHV